VTAFAVATLAVTAAFAVAVAPARRGRRVASEAPAVVVGVVVDRGFPLRGVGTWLGAFVSADRVDRRVVPRAVPGVERVPVAGTEPSA
jgi:hypothetical protein